MSKRIIKLIAFSVLSFICFGVNAQQIIGTGGTNDCGPIGLSANITNTNCNSSGSGQITPISLHCEGASSNFDLSHVNGSNSIGYYVAAPSQCPAGGTQCGNANSTINITFPDCQIGTTLADTLLYVQDLIINKTQAPTVSDCQYVIFEPGYDVFADEGATCAAVLPVELLDFSYTLSDGLVQLDWSTGSENGADYFAIQRFNSSLSTWETLEELTAIGYSSQLVNYTFIDEHPIIGESYYRLVQVDFDGTEDISEVLSVSREVSDDLVVNSVVGSKVVIVNSSIAGDKTYELVSNTGAIVVNGEFSGMYETLDFSDFSEGIYVLKVSIDGVYRIAEMVTLSR